MTYVHHAAKWTWMLSLCASTKPLFFALGFFFLFKFHAWVAATFFIPWHCGVCIQNLHRLEHRYELVYLNAMRHPSNSFACNVIFKIFGMRRFRSMVGGWMRFHYTTRHCWNSSQFQCPYNWTIVLEFSSDALFDFAVTWLAQVSRMLWVGLVHG